MGNQLLGRFLEACHDGPADLLSWCGAVTATLAPLIAPREGICIWVGGDDLRGSAVSAHGRAEAMLDHNYPQPTAGERRRAGQGTWGSTVFTARQCLGDRAARRLCASPFGFVDGIALTSGGGPINLAALIPLRERDERSPTERALHRAQRHLQAAVSLRADARWAEAVDLIVAETGKVLHCKPQADRLRRLAAHIAALPSADFGMGERADAVAAKLWDELLAGQWLLTVVRDSDGRRMLVLKGRKVEAAEQLTACERNVLSAAASRVSGKQAASDLGVTVSTFSTHLSRGLRKLGLQDRSQLLLVAGAHDQA